MLIISAVGATPEISSDLADAVEAARELGSVLQAIAAWALVGGAVCERSLREARALCSQISNDLDLAAASAC